MIIISFFQILGISLKRYFNWKRTLFIQLTCLALILLLGTIFSNFIDDYNAKQKIRLGLIVQDDHQYLNILLSNFTDNEQFTALFDISIDQAATIEEQFASGTLDAYVVIPKAFTNNMLNYRENHLKIYTHLGFPTKTKILKSLFAAYTHYVQNSNAATLAFYDLLTESNLTSEQIERANDFFSVEIISTALGRTALFNVHRRDALADISPVAYFSIALSFAVLGFAMIPLVETTYRDMQQQVGARLLVSGFSTSLYLLNLHAVQIVSALLQTAPLAILLALFSGVNPLFALIAFAAMTLFWSLLWLSLALLIKDRQLYFVSCAIVAFSFALLGGSITPFTILPLQIKLLANYSPILAFTKLGLNVVTNYQQLALWFALSASLFIWQRYLVINRKYGVL